MYVYFRSEYLIKLISILIPIIGPSPLELGFLMLRLSSLYKQSLYSFSKDLMINKNFYDLRCVSLLRLVVMPDTPKVVMPRVLQADP